MVNSSVFGLKSQIFDAIEVVKLNKAKMAEVASRPSATKWGILILVLPALLNWIFSALTYPSGLLSVFQSYVFGAILIPVLSLVAMIFVISLVAEKFFGAKGAHVGFFRVLAYGSILLWISVIPYLLALLGLWFFGGLFGLVSLAAGIWLLVVSYHLLIEHHKLSKENAVFALIAGIVGYFVIAKILGSVLVGPYFSLI
jgi:hypothetical protein